MFDTVRRIAAQRGRSALNWRWSVSALLILSMAGVGVLLLSRDSKGRDRADTSSPSQNSFVAVQTGTFEVIEKSDEETNKEEKASEEPADENMTEEKPTEESAAEEMTEEEKPAADDTTEEKADGDNSNDGEMAAEETTAEEKTTDESPSESATKEAAEEEKTAEESSTEEMTEEEKNSDEKPEGDATTEPQKEEEMAANEKPGEDPAEEMKEEQEKPTDGAIEEKTAEELEAEAQAAAENAAKVKAEIEQIITEKLAAEREAAQKEAAEQAATAKAVMEKALAERLAAERAAAERMMAERAAAERALIVRIQQLLDGELNKTKEQVKQMIDQRMKTEEKSIPGTQELNAVRADLESIKKEFESRIDKLERMQTQKYSAWKRAIGGEYYVCTYRCTPAGSDVEALNCAYFYPNDPKYIYFYNPTNCVYWGRYLIGADVDNEWEWLPLRERAIVCPGAPPKGTFAWKGKMPLVDQSLDTQQSMLWPSLIGLPGVAKEIVLRRGTPQPLIAPPPPAEQPVPANTETVSPARFTN